MTRISPGDVSDTKWQAINTKLGVNEFDEERTTGLDDENE